MNERLRILDLFSGIGGFSLGLERTNGFRTVAFCECEPYARRVLRRHWPTVPLFEDVRTLTARRLKKEGIEPNVICGGFPCQDISTAGKGKGIDGERSGLWKEMFRLVREIRPAWVIAENVPALRTRGADQVLADLEGAGYAAWPLVVGAVAVGAPHRRERAWVVAHRGRSAFPPRADEWQERLEVRRDAIRDQYPPDPWRGTESRILRVAHGVPARVDRLRCLGNAVVPQIPELIGRAILAHHVAGAA